MRMHLENIVEQMNYKDSGIVNHSACTQLRTSHSLRSEASQKDTDSLFHLSKLIQLQTLQETDIISLKNKK